MEDRVFRKFFYISQNPLYCPSSFEDLSFLGFGDRCDVFSDTGTEGFCDGRRRRDGRRFAAEGRSEAVLTTGTTEGEDGIFPETCVILPSFRSFPPVVGV